MHIYKEFPICRQAALRPDVWKLIRQILASSQSTYLLDNILNLQSFQAQGLHDLAEILAVHVNGRPVSPRGAWVHTILDTNRDEHLEMRLPRAKLVQKDKRTAATFLSSQLVELPSGDSCVTSTCWHHVKESTFPFLLPNAKLKASGMS